MNYSLTTGEINDVTTNLLILGSGHCAEELARQLAGRDTSIVIALADDQGSRSEDLPAIAEDRADIQVMTNARVLSVRGEPGQYQVGLRVQQASVSIQTERIVLADASHCIPMFASYGLTPSAPVMALSDVDHLLSHIEDAGMGPLDEARRAVFITGLAEESHPWILKRVMRSALRMQTDIGIQVYILTGNLKVADDGLEAMYRQCKQAGIIVLKFTSQMPQISQSESGHAHFQFTDEVTGYLFQLSPDITIVEEKDLPSPFVVAAADKMHLWPDRDGFAQADNVHRLTVLTSRRGIFAAGPARMAWGIADYVKESACAAMAAAAPLIPARGGEFAAAQIDSGRCIRCLTCLRVCHYGAIVLDPRPEVIPDLCERCGVCAAECPRKAVAIENLVPERLLQPLFRDPLPAGRVTPFEPAIVALCCSRSAVQAKDMALGMGQELPPNLKVVAVPCGGAISVDHVLESLRAVADGVILFTCHDGNCHSEKGVDCARQRVDLMAAFLQTVGLEAERVKAVTIASNMGPAFAGEISRFAREIGEMGPNPLLASSA
jgi:coenzyme F420-reducing hydrogenase delta subunit/ferredoxin